MMRKISNSIIFPCKNYIIVWENTKILIILHDNEGTRLPLELNQPLYHSVTLFPCNLINGKNQTKMKELLAEIIYAHNYVHNNA